MHLARIQSFSLQVFGEPGADLNYEETVVYSNEAIRPAYLMVYGQPPRKSLFTRLFKTPLAS
jgi:hypothetical protein